ncbi:MAG: MFS transporter [Alphaproteobacteria bacterium]|nr:MFS transporter [Alphaproteobacteria bacterium]
MAGIRARIRISRPTALLAFGLTANMAPFATFAAVLPEIARAWHLSASEAGWIGGIYFAGYAAAVPILSSLTDRMDGRRIFLSSTLLAAGASLAFATAADGFWTGLILRFLGGVALGGVHMPGLKLLAERTAGQARARGSGIYSACYTLGAAGSLFLAGAVEAGFNWRGAFMISGVVPLLAIGTVLLLPPPEASPAGQPTLDLRALFRNRALIAYVLAFAGNIWEVSAVRAWFVAYLAWSFALPHNSLSVPRPADISGLASLGGFAASILVAELALRWGPRAIVMACIASVIVLLALAATAGGPSIVILPLLVLAQIASLSDAAALASGATVASDPTRRGAALALFAFIGYLAAFIGPVSVGIALDLFGGLGRPAGWSAAFLTMALGSAAAALAMRIAPKGGPTVDLDAQQASRPRST